MLRPLKPFSADPHKDKLRVGLLCMHSFDIMFLAPFIIRDTVNMISVNFAALKWYNFIKLTQSHIIKGFNTLFCRLNFISNQKNFQFCRKLELEVFV